MQCQVSILNQPNPTKNNSSLLFALAQFGFETANNQAF